MSERRGWRSAVKKTAFKYFEYWNKDTSWTFGKNGATELN